MKLANVDGRAVVVTSQNDGIDVHEVSNGKFGPDLQSVYDNWTAFVTWWGQADTADVPMVTVERDRLRCPSPTPRQIFAIGLNYDDHASESGFSAPTTFPPTFTKFVSSLSGPDSDVTLPPNGNTDWEVELVLIMGATAHRVEEAQAWDLVAGVAVGQDLSERVSQLSGPAPQFSLGKSFPGFAPVGPWLVSPDELSDRDDLALGCSIDGETVQSGRTSDLIFSVPRLIAGLTRGLTLYPGDMIFTGTPSGVGQGRTPKRFLQDGERLHSWIEGVGELHQTFHKEA